MQLKDAMREGCLDQVADGWYQLLATYAGPEPDLCAFVLETMQRYISWIDIGLVANSRWGMLCRCGLPGTARWVP
jgi:exportin-T